MNFIFKILMFSTAGLYTCVNRRILWTWREVRVEFCVFSESMTGNDTEADHLIDWTALSNSECLQLNGVLFGSDCDTAKYSADVFMFSCLLFIGTFVIAMSLKFFRNTRFFPNTVTCDYCDS